MGTKHWHVWKEYPQVILIKVQLDKMRISGLEKSRGQKARKWRNSGNMEIRNQKARSELQVQATPEWKQAPTGEAFEPLMYYAPYAFLLCILYLSSKFFFKCVCWNHRGQEVTNLLCPYIHDNFFLIQDECINKLWFILIQEYYSAIKRCGL